MNVKFDPPGLSGLGGYRGCAMVTLPCGSAVGVGFDPALLSGVGGHRGCTILALPRGHCVRLMIKHLRLMIAIAAIQPTILSTSTRLYLTVQGHLGTDDTHVPPVPRESLLHLVWCGVQIHQRLAMVCSMNRVPDQNKRLTLVGFPSRVTQRLNKYINRSTDPHSHIPYFSA